MAFKSVSIGRIHVVRWLARPERIDILRLVAELASTRRLAGGLLVNMTVVPQHAVNPEAAARTEMLKSHRAWTDNCSSVNVVLEARGFGATLARAAIAELSLVIKHGVVKVHPSVDAAIAYIGHLIGRDRDTLRRQIHDTGVLADPDVLMI